MLTSREQHHKFYMQNKSTHYCCLNQRNLSYVLPYLKHVTLKEHFKLINCYTAWENTGATSSVVEEELWQFREYEYIDVTAV